MGDGVHVIIIPRSLQEYFYTKFPNLTLKLIHNSHAYDMHATCMYDNFIAFCLCQQIFNAMAPATSYTVHVHVIIIEHPSIVWRLYIICGVQNCSNNIMLMYTRLTYPPPPPPPCTDHPQRPPTHWLNTHTFVISTALDLWMGN